MSPSSATGQVAHRNTVRRPVSAAPAGSRPPSRRWAAASILTPSPHSRPPRSWGYGHRQGWSPPSRSPRSRAGGNRRSKRTQQMSTVLGALREGLVARWGASLGSRPRRRVSALGSQGSGGVSRMKEVEAFGTCSQPKARGVRG